MEINAKPQRKKITRKIAFAGLLIAMLLLASAAVRDLRAGNSLFLQKSQERRYELKGVVKSVDKQQRSATIRHEKVGDYMDAMTMPFPIRDDNALNAMEPGDRISGTLVVRPGESGWLEKIAILAKAKDKSTQPKS